MAKISRKRSVIKTRMSTFHQKSPQKPSLFGKMFGSRNLTQPEKRNAERKAGIKPTKSRRESAVDFLRKAHKWKKKHIIPFKPGDKRRFDSILRF